MLHAGRALPPLQKANSNHRDWVSGSSFLPTPSPTATELPHADRAPAASLLQHPPALHHAAVPEPAPSSCCRGDTRERGLHLSPSPAQEGALSSGGHEEPAGCTCCAGSKAGSSRAGTWHGLSRSVWDTPAHSRTRRWGFGDVSAVNHSLSQLNKCSVHRVSPGVSPPWLSPRKFPFPLIFGETIRRSIPSALSHDPVRAQSSSGCPGASTQPLSRCPTIPVAPVLV